MRRFWFGSLFFVTLYSSGSPLGDLVKDVYRESYVYLYLCFLKENNQDDAQRMRQLVFRLFPESRDLIDNAQRPKEGSQVFLHIPLWNSNVRGQNHLFM